MSEFRVIGELRTNPGHLLLLDSDGGCYEYDMSLDVVVPVEPNSTSPVSVIEEGMLMMVVPEKKILAACPRSTKAS